MNFKKIVIGTFLSLVVSFILICVLAVVVYFSNLQDRTISALIFALSSISVLCGAFFMARNITCRGLLNGAALAALYFVILAVISVMVNGGISLSLSNFLRFFACIAAGGLGGVLGINTNSNQAVA